MLYANINKPVGVLYNVITAHEWLDGWMDGCMDQEVRKSVRKSGS